jgi:hypothetical protein
LQDVIPNLDKCGDLPQTLVPEKHVLFTQSQACQKAVSPTYSRSVEDFWITDPISRRSKTLAKASQAFAKKVPFKGLLIY